MWAVTCTDVIDPLVVVVMRSCSMPRSVDSVGWYPTADGMRPSSADTSELACSRHTAMLLQNLSSAISECQSSFPSHVQSFHVLLKHKLHDMAHTVCLRQSGNEGHLCEPENVVNKKEHILPLFITEIFRDSEACGASRDSFVCCGLRLYRIQLRKIQSVGRHNSMRTKPSHHPVHL